MTTPKQLSDALDQRVQRLNDRIDDRIEDTVSRLLVTRRGLTHVVTGALQRSWAAFGPYPVAGNVLESRIGSNLFYAPIEERRGGEHASGARTLEQGRSELQRLTTDIERIVADAIEGR